LLSVLGALSLLLPAYVKALPTGASSCNVGSAAVGGPHLSRAETTTGLVSQEEGYRLTIDDQILTPNSTFPIAFDPTTDAAGGAQTITRTLVFSTVVPVASTFKGFSFILSAGTAAELEVTDDETQKVNSLCAGNAMGITHTNPQEKSKVELTLNIQATAATADIPLDVTIVVENSGTVSEYYYSRYLISIVDKARPPRSTALEVIDSTPSLAEFEQNIATVPAALALLESATQKLTVFGAASSAFDDLNDPRVLRILADPAFNLHYDDLFLYHIDSAEALSQSALLDQAQAEGQLTMATEDVVRLSVGNAGSSNFLQLNGQGTAATVITDADLNSTNSVVHVVNKILLPPSATRDIPAAINASAQFSTFMELIKLTELETTLSNDGPYTVFAPNNEAFEKMDPLELAYLRNNTVLLEDILRYHITAGVVASTNLQATERLTMLNDKQTTVQMDSDERGTITSTSGNIASLQFINNLANNGIIHGVTEVLIPEAIVIPSAAPSSITTISPSSSPSFVPSVSVSPTNATNAGPTTESPSTVPPEVSTVPNAGTSEVPSTLPTGTSEVPNTLPTTKPSLAPSISVSPTASDATLTPTTAPSVSAKPSTFPTTAPSVSAKPSTFPSSAPTNATSSPSMVPSLFSSSIPSAKTTTSSPTATANTTASPTSESSVPVTPRPTSPLTSQPSSLPSQMPTVSSTPVEISTSFVLFNTDDIEAKDLSFLTYARPLNLSFANFVEDIVAGVQSRSRQRRLRNTGTIVERRLESTLEDGSTELYNARDVNCPSVTSDGTSIPSDANCQEMFGRYILLVVGENLEVVKTEYTNATNQAIDEGKLQESILSVDPDSPFTVAGTPQSLNDDKSDDGMEWWLILVIVLCGILAVACFAFALYCYFNVLLKNDEEPLDENKAQSKLFESEEFQLVPPPPPPPPPPPATFVNVEEPVEDSWSSEGEELDEDVDDEARKFFSDQDTVDVEEEKIDESKDDGLEDDDDNKSAEDNGNGEEWEEEDTADDLKATLPAIEDEQAALLAIEDEQAEEEWDAEDEANENEEHPAETWEDEAEGNSNDEEDDSEAVDPPQGAHDGDAPGLRQSEVIRQSDDDGDMGTIGSQSWQVPDVSIEDVHDVEEILRHSERKTGQDGDGE